MSELSGLPAPADATDQKTVVGIARSGAVSCLDRFEQHRHVVVCPAGYEHCGGLVCDTDDTGIMEKPGNEVDGN